VPAGSGPERFKSEFINGNLRGGISKTIEFYDVILLYPGGSTTIAGAKRGTLAAFMLVVSIRVLGRFSFMQHTDIQHISTWNCSERQNVKSKQICKNLQNHQWQR
jgi:hypothetical protein